ncbi:Protein SYS1 [Tetrabaena socialis]|uniref:Protein SYS1 n=1 Tax=Tetrabaena socialis TaxID=47790 RepID=A0A2J7ZS02_9CHLO|nr:Protein SYS1 [Tetrabaena socialis]|eukprot:PNH03043.1 Protein SYS1 [Tetrabaena socialis]
MLYGAAVWDPALIVAQIVTLQCLFYLSLGLWQGLFIGPYVSHLSIAYLFSWRTYNFGTYVGWISVVSALLTSTLGAIFLVWIVERAKKCLDFAATCFLFHLCFCWRYDGFPARLEWWITNLLGLVIMSLFGEWLCLRREMQEIPLNTLRGRGASAGVPSAGSGASTSAGSSGTSSAVQMSGTTATKSGPAKGQAATQPLLASNV